MHCSLLPSNRLHNYVSWSRTICCVASPCTTLVSYQTLFLHLHACKISWFFLLQAPVGYSKPLYHIRLALLSSCHWWQAESTGILHSTEQTMQQEVKQCLDDTAPYGKTSIHQMEDPACTLDDAGQHALILLVTFTTHIRTGHQCSGCHTPPLLEWSCAYRQLRG